MRIQRNTKRPLLTTLLVGAATLGSFTTVPFGQAFAGGCGCEAAVCGCEEVSCGCEEPATCDCEPACGLKEPACGTEARLLHMPAPGCGMEAACGCEEPVCGCETPTCRCGVTSCDCDDSAGGFGIFERLRKRGTGCGLEAACACEEPACGLNEPHCGMETACGCESPACGCGEAVCGVEEPPCRCDVGGGAKTRRPKGVLKTFQSAAGKLRSLLKLPKGSNGDAGCDDGCDAAMIQELSAPVGSSRISLPPAVQHHSHSPHVHHGSGVPMPPPLVVRPSAPSVMHPAPMAPRSAPSAQPRMTQPRLVPSENVVQERAPLLDQPTTRSRMSSEVKPRSSRHPMLDPAPQRHQADSKTAPTPVPDTKMNEADIEAGMLFEDIDNPFIDDEVQVRRYQPVRPSSYHASSRSHHHRSAESSRRRADQPQLSTAPHRSSHRRSNRR